MSERKDAFIRRLEETGEAGVRENLILGSIYGGDHKGWATHWIAEIDQARSDALNERNHASNLEGLRIDRSAKNAAWVAAISAIIAIVISLVALDRSSS